MVLAIRTLILYSLVILALRIMGKRQLGELQPSELVVAIMISDLASIPMESVEIPLFSGIVPVLTLLIAEVMTSQMSLKSKTVRKFLSGEPSMVIYNGRINEGELRRMRFNLNDLMEELRLNNYPNIADVEVAVIETSGQLSVIPKADARAVTIGDMTSSTVTKGGLPYMLVADGCLNKFELMRSGKTAGWLENELKKRGVNGVKDVFLASLDMDDKLFVQMKEEKK